MTTYDAARYTAKYDNDGFSEHMRMIYPTSPAIRDKSNRAPVHLLSIYRYQTSH